MPNTTYSSIHANIMRLTKLNACGVPITGTGNKSRLVTDGLVKIGLSAEWEDGEDTTKKSGSGRICLQHKDPDQLKYLSPEIEFCGVDPEAWSLITGQQIVTDIDSNAVGMRLGSAPLDANFALEVWTDAPGSACSESGLPLYVYWLIPFIGSGKIGDIELSVSAAEFTLTAQTKPGTGWGAGPYDVVMNEGATGSDPNVAGPLITPLALTDHLHFQVTTVAPPAVTDGAVELAA